MKKATAVKNIMRFDYMHSIKDKYKIVCDGTIQTAFYPAELLSSMVSCGTALHGQTTLRKNEVSSSVKPKMMCY